MAIHPIEFRYNTPEMYALFTEENILQKKLDVEAALARAHAKLGKIPKRAARIISKNANTKKVELGKVKEIEKEIGHDIMAMVKALSEVCGGSGKYVHLGATSYDIVDTAWALIFKEAIKILEKEIKELLHTMQDLIKRYRRTVMLGRTHGQYANPITFGFKISVWAAEVLRQYKRLQEIKKRVLVGKMTGAVGTQASFGLDGVEIQRIVMKELKLGKPLATTQILQRDRHAEIIFWISSLASILDKIATEIRNLQRPEIGEVSEGFDTEKQVGSSTMPAKRNPVKCEQICGIARVLRSNVLIALENMISWHERDLANSSAERILFPESFVLIHYSLRSMKNVLRNLKVYPGKMEENLKRARGFEMSEAVMIKLVEKGMDRQEAHELVRKCSMIAFKNEMNLESVLKENGVIRKYFTEEELEEVMDPEKYLGTIDEQIKNVLKEINAFF